MSVSPVCAPVNGDNKLFNIVRMCHDINFTFVWIGRAIAPKHEFSWSFSSEASFWLKNSREMKDGSQIPRDRPKPKFSLSAESEYSALLTEIFQKYLS